MIPYDDVIIWAIGISFGMFSFFGELNCQAKVAYRKFAHHLLNYVGPQILPVFAACIRFPYKQHYRAAHFLNTCTGEQWYSKFIKMFFFVAYYR